MRPRSLLPALLASALLLLPAVHAGPAEESARHPLLWKVSDADNAVYLLGSFHLLKQDDYPLPAEVDRAFDDAESLLFEVDPAEMNSPETVAKMQQYMAYPDAGGSLSKVLPKPTLQRLDNVVTASGGSMQALEHVEPWAVNLGLVLGISRVLGLDATLGLDRQLMDRAAKAGKPAGGLETIDDQMRAMDAVPYDEQVQGLDEFLGDTQKAARDLQAMHGWWRAGDVDKLDSEMRVDMERKTPAMYRLLDVERNDAWLPQIEKRLADPSSDDTLVVVGSLHLLGSDGLVEKLRAKGYVVERVCDSCEAPAPAQ